VRFDHALFEGLVVSPHYDSMLGKLIAHAAHAPEAIDQLAGALDRTATAGPAHQPGVSGGLPAARDSFRAGQALIPFLQSQADGSAICYKKKSG
jgi:geranyl-CoA carboxylase alpha subunit